MRRARDLPVIALWIAVATVLSQLTTRVADWFSMTDEMRYERLAISIAQTNSLLPRIHDVNIDSLAQLYPLVLAPVFRSGYVVDDLHDAHLLNAWLMTSACIPAYLLARRVTRRRAAAYLAALLSVSIPWIFYAAMLLTEVVSYPAFLWAALALQRATATPSALNDALALLAAALVYFARTPLLLVFLILPVAILAFELRRATGDGPWRRIVLGGRAAIGRHRLLAAAYMALAGGALVLAATGRASSVLGIYGEYAAGDELVPDGFAGSFVEHVATFALGFGILPVVVGGAWLLANLLRPPADAERHAFACIGTVSAVALLLQVTYFDVRYTQFVHERFLMYLAPVVLIATLCALLEARRPRWSLLATSSLVALGFAFGAVPAHTWSQFPHLDPDTPASSFYKPLAAFTGGLGSAQALLIGLTAILTGLFLLGVVRLRPAHLTAAVATFLVIVLPLETGYVFWRLLSTPSISGRAITERDKSAFDWVDRRLGTSAEVTMVPYPVSSNYFVSQRVWRDYEFWNKSVVRAAHYPYPHVFEATGFWFPKLYLTFDRRTGAVDSAPTRYVLHSNQETRFRIAGPALVAADVTLIEAAQPWRVDWISAGLYEDGWTKPGVTVGIRVYAQPEEEAPRTRTLSIALRSPPDVAQRAVELRSNLGAWHIAATPDTQRQVITVCVPARGSAEVRVRAREHSGIPPNMRNADYWQTPGREGGVFLAEIALADEIGAPC